MAFYNADNLPPGDKDRAEVATVYKNILWTNPDEIIEDFGDYDEDYSAEEQRRSDGWGSSREDTDTYYESCRKQDIKITKPDP